MLGELAWHRLQDHPDFLDRIKFTQTALMTTELLARVLELERVLVGSAMFTSDFEGVAEASVSYTDIFNDDALMLYVADRPSLMTPSAGYTFVWRPLTGGGPQYIRRYRVDAKTTDYIEGRTYFDQVMTGSRAGVYMDDAVD